MSVGSLGMISSSVSTQLAQSQGSDVNRTQQETASQARVVQAIERAEQAGGIGHTEQEQEATDRDADGRRPWEITGQKPEDGAPDPALDAGPRQSKDPAGLSGRQLDLSG
jgi:hypothetical protein